jgi:hypothetical protein
MKYTTNFLPAKVISQATKKNQPQGTDVIRTLSEPILQRKVSLELQQRNADPNLTL